MLPTAPPLVRLYMLVDGTTNSFITQRQVSDLARIRPALPEDPDQVSTRCLNLHLLSTDVYPLVSRRSPWR